LVLACFFYFLISFFCFFGFGVYYDSFSYSDEVYFLTCFLLFLSFLGMTTSASLGTSIWSSFKSSSLFGCANWLIIQPLGCSWTAPDILGDFGLTKGDCLGETDFLVFLVGFDVYNSSSDYEASDSGFLFW
jgi:hypothetical protein